jgi:hypothetical protein
MAFDEPVEPQTANPDFKMSIGQRILGAANNFLQGMAAHQNRTGFNHLVNTGRGAYDQGKYDRAHQDWMQKYGPKPVTVKTASGASATGASSGGQ